MDVSFEDFNKKEKRITREKLNEKKIRHDSFRDLRKATCKKIRVEDETVAFTKYEKKTEK